MTIKMDFDTYNAMDQMEVFATDDKKDPTIYTVSNKNGDHFLLWNLIDNDFALYKFGKDNPNDLLKESRNIAGILKKMIDAKEVIVIRIDPEKEWIFRWNLNRWLKTNNMTEYDILESYISPFPFGDRYQKLDNQWKFVSRK